MLCRASPCTALRFHGMHDERSLAQGVDDLVAAHGGRGEEASSRVEWRDEHEPAVHDRLAVLPVHRPSLEVVREYNDSAPARLYRAAHGRLIDSPRPARNYRLIRRGGEASDSLGVPDQVFTYVPRPHDGKPARREQANVAAAVEQRGAVPPQLGLQPARVFPVRSADDPNRPCPPVLKGLAQQHAPFQEAAQPVAIERRAARGDQRLAASAQQLRRLCPRCAHPLCESAVLGRPEQFT